MLWVGFFFLFCIVGFWFDCGLGYDLGSVSGIIVLYGGV